MFDKRKWQKAQQTHAENKTTTTTRRNQRPIQREESRPIRRNRTEPKKNRKFLRASVLEYVLFSRNPRGAHKINQHTKLP